MEIDTRPLKGPIESLELITPDIADELRDYFRDIIEIYKTLCPSLDPSTFQDFMRENLATEMYQHATIFSAIGFHHDAETLKEMGINKDTIDALVNEGVIGAAKAHGLESRFRKHGETVTLIATQISEAE